MKILTLLLVLTSAFSVHSMEIKRLRTTGAYDAYFISGRIGQSDRYPLFFPLNRETRIVLSSHGGNPEGSKPFVEWFRRKVNSATVKPMVIVSKVCASSCITVLAGLNQMARQGKIRLIVDKDLSIGFHGCWNTGTRGHLPACTNTMAGQHVQYGMSREWILRNKHLYARPNEAYVVWTTPSQPLLKGSGLISHAEIRDLP